MKKKKSIAAECRKEEWIEKKTRKNILLRLIFFVAQRNGAVLLKPFICAYLPLNFKLFY